MEQFNDKYLNKLEKNGKLFKISSDENSSAILEIKKLKTYFPVYGGVFRKITGYVKAVDNVSFNLMKGEIFGLVGESGSGKSTIGRSIIRLYTPNSGDIFLHECAQLNNKNQDIKINLAALNKYEMFKFRSNIQMIFQDPYSSLNPRFTIMDIIEEPLKIHISNNKEKNTNTVFNLLEKVGLSKEHAFRFPHEFSGGQRQRIGIARALATNPKLIIADEPVSSLDVSIQAQIINLIQDLQEEFKMSFLFIAHDLSVVKHISKRIAVMYLGNIVEIGNSINICENPCHPYTKELLDSVPIPDPKRRKIRPKLKKDSPSIKGASPFIKGDAPQIINKPDGCGFHTRCPLNHKECSTDMPEFIEVEKDHFVACHMIKK